MTTTTTRKAALTTDQRYTGINRRFNRRAALLLRFGFRYEIVAAGVACFVRTDYRVREQRIAAAEVMHATNDFWIDQLAATLRR